VFNDELYHSKYKVNFFVNIEKRRSDMEILNKIKGWASAITEVGISIIALGIVLEILFNGQGIPFWPNISIVDNITAMVTALSAQGLVGLVAVWVLYHIYNRK
jgi:hypothetical protein